MFCSHLSTPACTECVAQTLWRQSDHRGGDYLKLNALKLRNSFSVESLLTQGRSICEQVIVNLFVNSWLSSIVEICLTKLGLCMLDSRSHPLHPAADLFYAFSICALTLVFIALIVGGCNTHNFYLSSYFYFLFILFYWQFADNRYLFSLLFGFWKL